jgi:hypothetical protein
MEYRRVVKNIPTKVKLGAGKPYEVLWSKDLGDAVGEARYTERQIVIKLGQSNKQTATTYLHEVFHALSDEHGLQLTEVQVLLFEAAFPYLAAVFRELEKKE